MTSRAEIKIIPTEKLNDNLSPGDQTMSRHASYHWTVTPVALPTVWEEEEGGWSFCDEPES